MRAMAMCGLGPVVGPDWKPMRKTRDGWQKYADKIAKREHPSGFWHGVVTWCGEYYRISIAGQPHETKG